MGTVTTENRYPFNGTIRKGTLATGATMSYTLAPTTITMDTMGITDIMGTDAIAATPCTAMIRRRQRQRTQRPSDLNPQTTAEAGGWTEQQVDLGDMNREW
jgi:hypothetical protein